MAGHLKDAGGGRACCKEFESLLSPQFFRALADPTRVAILARLAVEEQEVTVREVAGCCTTDYSVVSRHLATLRQAGILEAKKRGREVLYRVCHAALARRLRELADAIDRCCGSSRR